MKMIKLLKLLIISVIIVLPIYSLAADMSPKDMVFTKNNSGRFIYCNNVEFISRDDLADTSNPNPRYIMNNSLITGKYSFFASHVNHTEVRNSQNAIVEAGFDIELDVRFIATEDTTIQFTSLGFEVPDNIKYYYNGKSYTYEEAWGCMNAWASYLQTPIRQSNSGTIYNPCEFEPVTVDIKKGDSFYLSSIIPNYREVPFYRPVHLLCDFDITSGSAECNVCAFKSWCGLGNRDNVSSDIAFGSYVREKQYKGIADTLNRASVDLEYTIDDWVWGDSFLPVTVYNQYVPQGNAVNSWFTHLNPNADPWSKRSAAASDMMAFEYKDPKKLSYYGYGVKDSQKDDVWKFDIYHSDTDEYPGSASGYKKSNYIPNYTLNPYSPEQFGCNLGNYGVTLKYNITIKNAGEVTRYVAYNLNTTANNIVILRDANGNMINKYAVCKGATTAKSNDTVACVELPGMSETKFSVEIILPTNYVGGMENSLVIKDAPVVIPVYDSPYQQVAWDFAWTGKEYIKWVDGELYLSDDLQNWNHQPLSQEVKDIFHNNWSEYRLLFADGKYIVKPSMYDGVPYYGARELFTTVYFLNEDFTLYKEHEFSRYPTDMAYAKGRYFVMAGSRFCSDDLEEWKITDSSMSMPVDNGGRFCGYMKNGEIYLSTDGKSYLPVEFSAQKPLFIECIGDLYYSTNKNTLYLSGDGLYWDKFDFDETVSLVRRVGNKVLINNKHQISYCPKVNLAIKFMGKYLSLQKEIAFDENGSLIAAAEELVKLTGIDVDYTPGEYVAVRALFEGLGYTVKYDDELYMVSIE